MRAGQVVELSSGWLLDIVEIRWWSEDDGAVYGRAMALGRRAGRWSKDKYLGTVRGIEMLAVSRPSALRRGE